MRLVFMGSNEMACVALERLLSRGDAVVSAVITQPDKPRGRRLVPSPSPVKALAEQRGLRVWTPMSVNQNDAVAALRSVEPDLIAVVGYGQILKPPVLEMPRWGCVNLHASLLPRHRGAAPIQWAIAMGDRETGVTTFFMDRGLDTGDLIFQERLAIEPEDTAQTLGERLAVAGAELLVRTVRAIADGTAPRVPQPPEGATYARRLTKEDGRIDWRLPALQIERRIRGFFPWPVCFTTLPPQNSKPPRPPRVLRVLRARIESSTGGNPGEVLEADATRGGPLVATGDGALRLLVVQPEGRPAMDAAAYLRGHRLMPGSLLGA